MASGIRAPGTRPHHRVEGGVRRWAARLLAGGFLLAALLTAVHLVIQHRITSAVDLEGALHRFEQLGEDRLGRDVEIGGLRLRTLPRPGLELRRVRIAHRPGITELHLGTARSALLEADLTALLLGDLVIKGISLRGVDLNLSDESGARWPEIREGRDPTEPVGLRIREIQVVDGTFSYRDVHGRVRVDAHGVRLEARRRPATGGWRLELRVEARRVHGRPPPPLPPLGPVEVEGRLSLEGAGDSIRLVPSSFRVGPARLSVRGERRPDGRLRLSGELHDLSLRSLPTLPGDGRTAGYVAGHLAVAHRPGDSAVRVAGHYRLRDLSVSYPGGAPIREGDGSGRLRNDTLFLDSLSARVLEEPAQVRGRVDLVPGLPYRLHFRGEPRIADLLELAGEPETSGEGRLKTQLTASGTLVPSPLPRTLRGSLSPRGVRLTDAGLPAPLALPGGRIRLEGREARTGSLPILLGRHAFAFTGTASRLLDLLRDPDGEGRNGRPEIRGSLTGPALDLSTLTRGDPGRPPPSPVDLNLTVRLDTLRVGAVTATAVSTRLRMGSGILILGPARLEIWGGTVRPDVTLGLHGGGDPTAFGVRLRMDSIRAGPPLRQLLGAREPLLRGRVSGRMRASGEVSPSLSPTRELLAGSARGELIDGRLSPTAVTRAAARETGLPELEAPRLSRVWTRVRFSGAGLSLDSLRAETRTLAIRARGSVDFHGSGRLEVGLGVPYGRLDPAAPIWKARPPASMLNGSPPPDRPVWLQLELVVKDGRTRVELRGLRRDEGLSGGEEPPPPGPGSRTSDRPRSADRPATRWGDPPGRSMGPPARRPRIPSSLPRTRPWLPPADVHPKGGLP